MEFSQDFQDELSYHFARGTESRLRTLNKLRTMYIEGGFATPIALRKAMQAVGYVCPVLILDQVSGLLVIKKWCTTIIFNGDVCISFTAESIHQGVRNLGSRVVEGDLLYVYCTRDGHAEGTHYETSNGTSSTLEYWIAFGDFCPECGEPFLAYDSHNICPACEEANEPHPYSTRAEDYLGHEETTDHKFGIELEYENVTSKQVAKTIPKHAIAKRDATINNGVEVVTRPACADTHKKEMKAFFNAVRTKAYPNTGMHIHIDKKNLSQYRVGFMLWFFNHRDNYSTLTEIAGRDFGTNRFCTLQAATMTSFLRSGRVFGELSRGESGKYVPFNTNKRETYEVRIFRSPETHLEMCAKLDFLKALMDYSSPYSVSVKNLTEKVKAENFLSFALKNRKDYPDFYKYFKPTLFAA